MVSSETTDKARTSAPKAEQRVYRNTWDYYADEWRRLDLLLGIQMVLAPDESPASEKTGPSAEELTAQLTEHEAMMEQKLERSLEQGVYMPLYDLAERIDLTMLDVHIILFCLAPEVDRKYEGLYAFLQDDATAKYPTLDLIAKTLSIDEDHYPLRAALAPGGALRSYFLQPMPDPYEQPILTRPLRLDERIVRFLLDVDAYDQSLAGVAELVVHDAPLPELLIGGQLQARLRSHIRGRGTQNGSPPDKTLIFMLHGPSGAGKKLQVRHFCCYAGKALLLVNAKRLVARADGGREAGAWINRLFREALLLQAVLCFDGLQQALADEQKQGQWESWLLEGLERYQGVLFLLAEKEWKPQELMKQQIWSPHELSIPDAEERKNLWQSFAREYETAATIDWGSMAGRFRFTPGQIKRALQHAAEQATFDSDGGKKLSESGIIAASRLQIHHRLADKATRLEPKRTWDELILPPEQLKQMQDACNQVKFRYRVFGEWGFERKLSYGKGLSMLFSGPPGTEKTMSAEIIAKEVGLELYKIDLSRIVSKYIGETEKGLQEVFQEAQLSQAILFFDEADALFGKRSEVKDSHDKYANLETSYLLQKMEEYEGISILTTNYQQNIDEAFVRRLTYVIKFPFPDAVERQRLWQAMFPAAAPLAADVDFRFLAETFELAGGSIKNAVVTAAFLAAEEGPAIGMKHLLAAVVREISKTGAIVRSDRWGEYADLFPTRSN